MTDDKLHQLRAKAVSFAFNVRDTERQLDAALADEHTTRAEEEALLQERAEYIRLLFAALDDLEKYVAATARQRHTPPPEAVPPAHLIDEARRAHRELGYALDRLAAVREAIRHEISVLEESRTILGVPDGPPLLASVEQPRDGAEARQQTLSAPKRPLFVLEPKRTPSWWARQLERCANQTEALIRIAELNDGVLRVIVARDILRTIGLSKSKPGTLRSHIYQMAMQSGRFEGPDKGVFRLLPASPALEPEGTF